MLPIAADMPQEVTKLQVKAFRPGRPSKRSRPAETQLDDTWSFGDGADIGSSSTEPAPYPLPLPGLAHTFPFADIVGVPVPANKSREASDDNIRPPFHTHQLCTQVASKATAAPTAAGSRFRHGRGRQEHRRGEHGNTRKSTRARVRAARGGRREHAGKGSTRRSLSRRQPIPARARAARAQTRRARAARSRRLTQARARASRGSGCERRRERRPLSG